VFRLNLVRAGALAAIVLVPSACSDGDVDTSSTSFTASPSTTGGAAPTAPSSTAPVPTTNEAVRVIEVSYAGGQVAGGAQRATVRLGEKVRLRVTSDVADEVHVHTYDLRAAVGPGQPADVELVASIPGRHEVELEKKHRQLLVLEVR
jgi:hypothetical protein